MIAERLHRIGIVAAWCLGFVTASLVALAVGSQIPSRPELALAASGAMLVLGVTALQPTAVPLVAAATLLVVHRVAFRGIDLTVSDAVLFVAVWPAVFFARRGYSQQMRTVLWLIVIYQVATLFTVIANPNQAAALDWLHSGMLAGGALIVGWAIGRQGQARLGIFLSCSCSVVCSPSARSPRACSSTLEVIGPPCTRLGRTRCTRTSSAPRWLRSR